MNPIGASILSILAVTVLFGSKRAALMGMVGGALYLTQAQHLEIGGLNLFAYRFLEIAAVVRVLSRGELSLRLNRIDWALLLLYSYAAVVLSLRTSEGRAFQIGAAVDAYVCYFFFRSFLANVEEFKWFLRAFILLLAPYALMMVSETMTNHNWFVSSMGGNMYSGADWFRGGRLRA